MNLLSAVHAVRLAVMLITLVSLARPPSCKGDETLIIASPHWEGIRQEFEVGFTAHMAARGRPVTLRWIDVGGTSDILKFIKGEFERTPDGIGIDLFFGGGTDPYLELASLDLLESVPVSSHLLDGIPKDLFGVPLYDQRYRWYAAALAGFGILYNKPLLERMGLPAPRTWEDTARPEYFSWVGSADPRKSGSVHMVYELILQAYGWEEGWRIIYGIGANARTFSSNSTQPIKDVSLGEVAIAFTIDSYVREARKNAGSDAIGFIIPDGLSAITGDGIAVLKGAPSRALAKDFLEFVISPQGQRLFLLERGAPGGPSRYTLGKMSVRPSLYAEPHVAAEGNPFTLTSSLRYDARTGSSRWSLLNDLLGAFVIDVHNDLRGFRRSRAAGDIASLGAPISEGESQLLVRDLRLSSPLARSQLLTEWGERARDKLGAARVPFSLLVLPITLLGLCSIFAAQAFLKGRIP